MAEICFLGTGGWVATPQRESTSILFRAGGKLTLIDCAGSVVARIRRLKMDPRSVSAVRQGLAFRLSGQRVPL
jgi:ribonuclease BN (tRNA processing enzyme)